MHYFAAACLAPGSLAVLSVIFTATASPETLPKSWSLLTLLFNLQVTDNKLTGTLHPEYSRLVKLFRL